jgi:hypothetical protein
LTRNRPPAGRASRAGTGRLTKNRVTAVGFSRAGHASDPFYSRRGGLILKQILSRIPRNETNVAGGGGAIVRPVGLRQCWDCWSLRQCPLSGTIRRNILSESFTARDPNRTCGVPPVRSACRLVWNPRVRGDGLNAFFRCYSPPEGITASLLRPGDFRSCVTISTKHLAGLFLWSAGIRQSMD